MAGKVQISVGGNKAFRHMEVFQKKGLFHAIRTTQGDPVIGFVLEKTAEGFRGMGVYIPD